LSSSFVSLQLVKMKEVISIFLYLLRFALCPKIYSFL
jgi:hypothetical protein